MNGDRLRGLPQTKFLWWRYTPAENRLLHRFLTSWITLGATVLLLILVVCAILGPWIVPVDPIKQDLSATLRPPMWMKDGDSRHILGTDRLGRDILSNIIYGLRISLLVGFLSVGLSLVIGLTLGLLAGYARGFWEDLIMRLVDIQLSLPLILVALSFMAVFGRGLFKLALILALVGWAEYARTVRSTVLSIREKEYVEAARALGFGPITIMVKHMLINSLTPVIILSGVQVPRVIILEATLSFLGLGVPVTIPSLGQGIARGYQVLFSGSWWASILPGLTLVLLVGCINTIADWLRDSLEPRFN